MRAAVHRATRPLLSTGAGLGATRRWGRSGDPRPQLLLLRSLPSRSAGTEHARDLHMRWDIFGQWRQQSGRCYRAVQETKFPELPYNI